MPKPEGVRRDPEPDAVHTVTDGVVMRHDQGQQHAPADEMQEHDCTGKTAGAKPLLRGQRGTNARNPPRHSHESTLVRRIRTCKEVAIRLYGQFGWVRRKTSWASRTVSCSASPASI